MSEIERWIPVCEMEDLVDNSGVCALIDNQQVAIFKVNTSEQTEVHAISNWDPLGKANVLYRGLIGSVSAEDSETRYVLASPLYKQRFCLSSGECLDDESARVDVFPTRVVGNTVQLGLAS